MARSKKRSRSKRSKSRKRSQARAISVARARSRSNPCGPGRLLKKSYRRKSYSRKSKSGKKVHVSASRVGATCIKDVGKPGYGPKLIPPLKRHVLSQFGYSTSKNAQSRARAIARAVSKLGKAEVYKHAVAVRTLLRSNERAHSALNKDVKMMRAKYYPKRKKSSYKTSNK
jgi:hypothetical protein